jgi:LAO/AO transport system kinase
LVLINKADLDPDAATRAQAQITSAMRLLGLHGRPEHAHFDEQIWHPQVMQISALKAQGMTDFWQLLTRFRELQQTNGSWQKRRQQQSLAWMWDRIRSELIQGFRAHETVKTLLPELQQRVLAGEVAPSTAARQLLTAQRN